jgi:hypothetical protein
MLEDGVINFFYRKRNIGRSVIFGRAILELANEHMKAVNIVFMGKNIFVLENIVRMKFGKTHY